MEVGPLASEEGEAVKVVRLPCLLECWRLVQKAEEIT